MKRPFAPTPLPLLLILPLILLVACAAPTPTPSTGGVLQTVGVYDYEMIEDGTDNLWDAGVIDIHGDRTYTLTNSYAIEYEGEWDYNDQGQLVTFGAIQWVGFFDHTNQLSGTWTHENGATGTWVAVRQQPLDEVGP